MQSIEIHIETLLRRHPELAPAAPAIRETIEMILAAFRAGNTLFCCGNGGSAADAQHIAAELSGRYLAEREPLDAAALSCNASALTAIGNDYGFDRIFARQLEARATFCSRYRRAETARTCWRPCAARKSSASRRLR